MNEAGSLGEFPGTASRASEEGAAHVKVWGWNVVARGDRGKEWNVSKRCGAQEAINCAKIDLKIETRGGDVCTGVWSVLAIHMETLNFY